jgi:hypothetical protein
MRELNDKLDSVISGVEIGLGVDDCYWSAIEAAVRVLKLVKELAASDVEMSKEDFSELLIETVGDV